MYVERRMRTLAVWGIPVETLHSIRACNQGMAEVTSPENFACGSYICVRDDKVELL